MSEVKIETINDNLVKVIKDDFPVLVGYNDDYVIVIRPDATIDDTPYIPLIKCHFTLDENYVDWCLVIAEIAIGELEMVYGEPVEDIHMMAGLPCQLNAERTAAVKTLVKEWTRGVM